MSAKAASGKPDRNRTSHRPRRDAEELRRENERLRRENERLREQAAEHEQQTAEHEQQIAAQEQQIADLERQLAAYKKNSTNSSKPPSSEPSAVPPAWQGNSGAGADSARAGGNRAASLVIPGGIGNWFRAFGSAAGPGE